MFNFICIGVILYIYIYFELLKIHIVVLILIFLIVYIRPPYAKILAPSLVTIYIHGDLSGEAQRIMKLRFGFGGNSQGIIFSNISLRPILFAHVFILSRTKMFASFLKLATKTGQSFQF